MKTIVTMVSLLVLSAAGIAPAQAGHAGMVSQNISNLSDLDGKPVIGARGQSLGYVLSVDRNARKIELQTPSGIGVSMPASMFAKQDGSLIALNTSRRDVMAMAKRQTGHTLALNIDLRHRGFRG